MNKNIIYFISVITTIFVLIFSITIAENEKNMPVSTPKPSDNKLANKIDTSKYNFFIYYSGNRRSELEPCGCKKKQLGGIDREAGYLESSEVTSNTFIKLDSGGFILGVSSPTYNLKSKYLLKALSKLNYDAINVSYTDMNKGLKFLCEAESEYKLNFISANIVDVKTKKTYFSTI